jgi:hypothetical protein
MTDYSVGIGVQTAMTDHNDEARSDERFIVNDAGSKVSETIGRDNIYYWLEVDNAVRVVPFRT